MTDFLSRRTRTAPLPTIGWVVTKRIETPDNVQVHLARLGWFDPDSGDTNPIGSGEFDQMGDGDMVLDLTSTEAEGLVVEALYVTPLRHFDPESSVDG